MKDLELHVPETTTQSSVIPVNWCLSPRLLQQLKDDSASNGGKIPYILLVTTPEENWKVRINYKLEIRKAVPVYDLLAYVDFKRPGENAIAGLITFNPDIYLQRENFCYGSDIFDNPIYWTNEEKEKTTEPSVWPCVQSKLVYDLIKVNVPSEVFAKPPPQWEQDWVNLWFLSTPHDQCNYRRRRIVAYTIQPIVLFAFALLKFVLACFWLSIGQKIGKIKDVINPITSASFEEILKKERWLVLPGIENWTKHLANIALPLFWIINFYLSYAFGVTWWAIPLFLGMVATSIQTLISLVFGMFYLYDLYKEKRNNKHKQKKIIKTNSGSVIKTINTGHKVIKKLEKAEAGLICNSQTYFKPKDLPKQSRTIKIMYEGVKASICRPFSQ